MCWWMLNASAWILNLILSSNFPFSELFCSYDSNDCLQCFIQSVQWITLWISLKNLFLEVRNCWPQQYSFAHHRFSLVKGKSMIWFDSNILSTPSCIIVKNFLKYSRNPRKQPMCLSCSITIFSICSVYQKAVSIWRALHLLIYVD